MDRQRHAPEPRAGSELNLRELPRAFRRRWRLFSVVAVAAVTTVMLVTLLIPPQYESEASFRVRTDQLSGLAGRFAGAGVEDMLPMGANLPIPGLDEMEGGHVQTEIGVLQSRLILGSVMDSLALHVELTRPWRAFRTQVMDVRAGENAPRGTYTFRRQGDGSYQASSRFTREEVELPDRVEIGQPFQVGPMVITLRPELLEDPPGTIQFRVLPYHRTFRSLRRDVRIERADAGSRLVETRYRNTDPHLAQALVNGITERLVEYSLSEAVSDPRREARILEGQVAAYGERLQEVEENLRSYQQAERLVAPEEQAVLQVERIAEVQVTHDLLDVERQALSALLGEVTAVLADNSVPPPYRRLATFPTFITNEAIQELLAALTDLENRRSELLVQRTEENIDVRRVQERIREIEEELFVLGRDYMASLDLQLASARSALDRFEQELERMPAVELEYLRLTRERRLLNEIYLALRTRLAETQVQEIIDDARVRLVDRGVIEDRPAFPRPSIALALSGVLALMLGTFSVVAAETTNPNVRTRRDVEEAADAPLLGTVPRFSGARRRAGDGALVTLRDPWHPASERFRGLALTLLAGDPAPRLIVIASASRGDGRTTVAANLAAALAQQGVRTALVDGDLRGGTLHSLFGVPAQPGWPQAAVGGTSLEDAARRVDAGGSADASKGALDLFPAGMVSGHPLEILGSPKVRTFLETLAERYDAVVLDTPALAHGHDAAVLAAAADAAILVAREDTTRKEALGDAADQLRQARGRVLGVALNGVASEAGPVRRGRG